MKNNWHGIFDLKPTKKHFHPLLFMLFIFFYGEYSSKHCNLAVQFLYPFRTVFNVSFYGFIIHFYIFGFNFNCLILKYIHCLVLIFFSNFFVWKGKKKSVYIFLRPYCPQGKEIINYLFVKIPFYYWGERKLCQILNRVSFLFSHVTSVITQ